MSTQWSGRPEGGGRFAIWLILTICAHFGRNCARAILYPITLYFFLRRGFERRMSRAFLTRAFGRPAGSWQIMRHIYTYAATILDRAFLLTESFRRFEISVQGLDQLDGLIAQSGTVLLIGAHVGSFEALRVLSQRRPELRVRVVMDRQQTPVMTEMLHALNPKVAADVIDPGGDPATLALNLQAAAEQGALIGLLGDRARPGERTEQALFLGAPASFPVSPYLLASMLNLPVMLCFGLYRGGNRYDLYFETFAETLKIERRERRERLQECVSRYAARLEHYTRIDPYNWFNFYDFWNCSDAQQPDSRPRAVGEPARAGGKPAG